MTASRIVGALATAPILVAGLFMSGVTPANSAPLGANDQSSNARSSNAQSSNAQPSNAQPASAQAAAACPSSSGVTVVVDFGGWRKIGCAAGDPKTGLAALTAAGFTKVMVARFPAMVCRINGVPKASIDPCVVTAPPTRYWSYWHAARGGTWTYSSAGAATFNPKPGTVEGWAYGAGTPPKVPPPARITAEPSPSGEPAE